MANPVSEHHVTDALVVEFTLVDGKVFSRMKPRMGPSVAWESAPSRFYPPPDDHHHTNQCPTPGETPTLAAPVVWKNQRQVWKSLQQHFDSADAIDPIARAEMLSFLSTETPWVGRPILRFGSLAGDSDSRTESLSTLSTTHQVAAASASQKAADEAKAKKKVS
jgi:hypothetical protein